MKNHKEISSLTETELKEELIQLERVAKMGDLTSISAIRMIQIKAALSNIKRALRP